MRPITVAVLALCVCAIVLGLTFGQMSAKLSETEVIKAYAAQYVQQTGGQATDCAARPSPLSEVWMVITCGVEQDQRIYFVDVKGRQLDPPDLRPET